MSLVQPATYMRQGVRHCDLTRHEALLRLRSSLACGGGLRGCSRSLVYLIIRERDFLMLTNRGRLLHTLLRGAVLLCAAASITSCANRHTGSGYNADLVPTPPTRPTVFERASTARAAIRKGDFAQAQNLIAADYAQSRIGRWSFQPYATFAGYVTAPGNDAFRHQLDAWVAADPKSPTAYLLRAAYERQVAWLKRGNGFANDVGSAHQQAFTADITASAHDIHTSLLLDAHNPYAWYLDVLIERDAGGNDAQQAAFEQAIAHYPDYYPLYSVRLAGLQPKWFGSVDAMDQFVQHHVGTRPANSPLRVLYVELYSHLLSAARMGCYSEQGPAYRQCLDSTMTQTASPAITNAATHAIATALQGGHTDALHTVGQQLTWMLTLNDSGQAALPLLETAATALHSDVQLTAADTAHNNWMIDYATAEFWDAQSVSDSAIKLDHRALTDLQNSHFASINDEDAARAMVYEELAGIYDNQNDYRNVVAYGSAVAKLLGGFGAASDSDHLVCRALFHLHRYQEGLRVCSAIVSANNDEHARFYRAHIHEALHQTDAAIHDYTEVADSAAGDTYREYAAIAVSNLYADRHDFRKALATLDQYEYLFPTTSNDAYSEASYYNDRCYNEMHLNQLDAALGDCNMSIAFKPLPDALKKHAMILKRQAAQAQPTSST